MMMLKIAHRENADRLRKENLAGMFICVIYVALSRDVSILSAKEINSYKFLHCFLTLKLVFYFVIPDSLQIPFFSSICDQVF